MDFTSLKETADALQLKAGLATPANQSEAGWWLQIALAAEGIAGASTTANPTTIGYMLRAAKALETAYGGNGLQENASYEGFLERIADALELNTGLLTGGNLARRIRVSALALSDTALRQLNLTNLTVAENTAATTLVGALTGIRAGSVFALIDSAGTRFALSGTNINTGATLTNFEAATSHNIIVRETNAGFTGSPKDSTITINVSNVFEAANLNALTLSDAAYITGTAESGTIGGLTIGSTLSVSGSLPSGFTVDTTARTWAWSGAGSVSTPSIILVETLADSANSPRSSTINLTVTAPAASTLVAPPQISGDAFVGGILYVDDGLDSPTTTYTRQWVSGATETPTTPISSETSLMYTVGVAAGQYVRCAVTPANGEAVRYSDTVRIHAAAMTAPVLLRTSISGASPFTYTTQYPDTTTWADDIERAQYASDFNFTTILWDATRGLTEAAFVTPFTSDETIDADPAWTTLKPVLAGTYFVRRKAIALNLLGGLTVESDWSNIESNFVIDTTVKLSATQSYTNGQFSDNNYILSGDLLSFTAGSANRVHAAVVNFSKTGDRTIELDVTALPTGAWMGIGFDDGTFDWTRALGADDNPKQIGSNGWKGAWAGWLGGGSGWDSFKADGTTTIDSTNGIAGNALDVADRLRARFTPGTFTGATPNNNGVLELIRIRAGVEIVVVTVTGVASFTPSRAIFASNFSGAATIKATALTNPVINVGSSEYQT